MDEAGELQLSDYLGILRRRWLWVAVPVVLFVALAVALTLTAERRYTATAAVLLRPSAAEDAISQRYRDSWTMTRELTNEISYATSDALHERVEAELGVVPTMDVEGDTEADLLRFTSTASSPELAARFANGWADAYVDAKRADALASITDATDDLSERLGELRRQRQELRQPLDELRDEIAGLAVGPTGEPLEPARRARLELQMSQLEADLAPEMDLIQAQEEAVAQALANLELQGQLANAGTARVVSQAAPPEAPSNAPLSRNVALALVVGAIVGVAAALVRESLDRRIKDSDQAGASVGLPVLTATPKVDSGTSGDDDLALATLYRPNSPLADSYNKLRTALQFANFTSPVRSVLVTSPNQGEGKTVTSTNLAWAMASVIDDVVLVDGDLRRPRVHKVYGGDTAVGLTDLVLFDRRLDDVAIAVEAADCAMRVLATGPLPPQPSDFLASRRFGEVFAGLAHEDRLVVVDGPPVLPVSDALTLARLVDAVLVVARAGRTSRDDLRRAVDALHQVGATVIGIVLTGVDKRAGDYRYGYYAPDEDTGDDGRATPVPEPPSEDVVPGVGHDVVAQGNGSHQPAPTKQG